MSSPTAQSHAYGLIARALLGFFHIVLAANKATSNGLASWQEQDLLRESASAPAENTWKGPIEN